MELQIQDLVASIKEEGINKATEEASKIISDSQAKAQEIIEKAKLEAQKTLEEAKQEIEILKQSAKLSAQQAQRDAVLSFRKEVEKQIKRILNTEVRKAMNSQTMASLIKASLLDKNPSDYKVEIKEASDALKASLADELEKGLEIKPVSNISAGFRLSSKDNSGFFDCTDEEVSQMLLHFIGELKI